MEPDDQPTSEKPTDEQGAGSQVIRSYECTFCKRGFSNAQALGGHMNIHRKDKAKLKQSSNEPQPSLNIQKFSGSAPLRPEERTNPNWPRNISQQDASSRDETQVVHIRQLPLFAETPSSRTHKPEGPIHREIAAENNLSSGQGSSSDLDLELRLGPDPQDPSEAMGTRKFF